MNSAEEKNEMPPDMHERGPYGRGRCGGRRRFWMIPFFVIGMVAVKSAIVMALWNLLVPDVFHGPALDYLQAVELTALVTVLVGFGGGFRGRFGGHGGFGRGMHPGMHHRGRHLRERWMKMSPEEREKMREEMRKRWEGGDF